MRRRRKTSAGARSLVADRMAEVADWGEVFPSAACVVSLVDRLMHRAEVVRIDAKSYRQKEEQEREAQRVAERAVSASSAPCDPRATR